MLISLCTRTLKGGDVLDKKREDQTIIEIIYSQYRPFHVIAVIIAIVGSIFFIRQINAESLANGAETLALWRGILVTICFSIIALVISGGITVLAIITDAIDRGGKPHSS